MKNRIILILIGSGFRPAPECRQSKPQLQGPFANGPVVKNGFFYGSMAGGWPFTMRAVKGSRAEAEMNESRCGFEIRVSGA